MRITWECFIAVFCLSLLVGASTISANNDVASTVKITEKTSGTTENNQLLDLGILDSEAFLFKRETDLQNTTQKAREMLQKFNRSLRSFVTDSGFDYVSFEPNMDSLRNLLSDIEFLVETELEFHQFESRLNFSRIMFQSMVDSTDKLKRYGMYELPGHELIYEMIALNVKVLSMFDSHGSFDLNNKEAEEKLPSLFFSLYVWESDFQKLNEVHPGVRMVFENKCAQVKRILQLLWKKLQKR
ncbi:hypothetical protein JCM33374_g2917 [Metschnikowia sp. JCM 33374]|nr:hypothetical protein JCM33374_g2917 [Metschnikowia sp. JCM 33374]